MSHVKRVAAPAVAAPLHADEAQWADPTDTVQTRSPKLVRGYRRGDVLGRYHRRGSDVTPQHLDAANRFRVAWDIAQFGLSGTYGEPMGRSPAGPSSGPSANAVKRVAFEAEVQRVLGHVAPADELLLWVVIGNKEIKAWCAAQALRTGKRPCEKKTFGRLLAVLDQLVAFFGIDSARSVRGRS